MKKNTREFKTMEKQLAELVKAFKYAVRTNQSQEEIDKAFNALELFKMENSDLITSAKTQVEKPKVKASELSEVGKLLVENYYLKKPVGKKQFNSLENANQYVSVVNKLRWDLHNVVYVNQTSEDEKTIKEITDECYNTIRTYCKTLTKGKKPFALTIEELLPIVANLKAVNYTIDENENVVTEDGNIISGENAKTYRKKIAMGWNMVVTSGTTFRRNLEKLAVLKLSDSKVTSTEVLAIAETIRVAENKSKAAEKAKNRRAAQKKNK